MSENKRFKIYSDFDDWSIIDTTGEYVAEDYLEWMSEKQVCDLLNEQEELIKQLKNRCEHHEHHLRHYQKEKENLTNMIKQGIRDINSHEHLSEHDKILAIHQLKWVLIIISEGVCEEHENIELVYFGKTIGEICSTFPPEDK